MVSELRTKHIVKLSWPRVNQGHSDVLKHQELEELTSRGPLLSTLFYQ